MPPLHIILGYTIIKLDITYIFCILNYFCCFGYILHINYKHSCLFLSFIFNNLLLIS